jgi:hypothetical protein
MKTRIAPLWHARLSKRQRQECSLVTDFIVIVLGTGTILMMAAYAALCERI